MPLDPWSYADKYRKEHAHQTALFMWSAMAQRFGPIIADDPHSYIQQGFAKTQFDNAGKLGYKLASEPIAQLKWLHAVHNQGHGDAIRGGMAKAEGVKAGVSDIFLPVPIRGTAPLGMTMPVLYCGLYLELKVDKNKPSNIQNEFMRDMVHAGYACCVAWGWVDARDKILEYLQLKA